MTSYDNVDEKDLKKLKRYGYEFTKAKSGTELARLSGETNIILYKTGKLLIQGSKDSVEEASKLVEFLGITPKGYSGIAVGTDEALKGDTFGGIVVAGFLADPEIKVQLKAMGVKDSKALLNPDVVRIAQEIIEKFPSNYHVESIFPLEYNKLTTQHNVTEILNMLHEKCYKKLAGRKDIMHIVDLYPGCSVGGIRETKAESKYLEVAAASVIARYFALRQIRELEQKAGFFIPLGSTHVESALLEIRKKSLRPQDYVKTSFRNVVAFFK